MSSPASNFSARQLVLFFLISVCVFLLFRWDMNTWIRHNVDAMIAQHHLNISYDGLQLSRGGIVFTGVDIQLPTKTLSIDRVAIAPAWSEWMSMQWGLKLTAKNKFLACSGLISADGEQIQLQHAYMYIDMPAAQAWLAQPLPVQLHGNIQLQSGLILFDNASGMSLHGDMELNWNKAEVMWAQQAYPLGDYKSQINITKQLLVWSISGGRDLLLNGKGQLVLQQGRLMNSSLTGDVDIAIDMHSALKQLLPVHLQHVHLSGRLASPQWQLSSSQ